MTKPSDDENKPVDLGQFRHRRAMTAYKTESDAAIAARNDLRSAAWATLNDLWNEWAEGLPKVPCVGQVGLSSDPGVILMDVLLDLMWLAQVHGADKEDIRQSLVDAVGLLTDLEQALAEMADRYVGRRLKVIEETNS